KLLGHQPFAAALADPRSGERLKALNLVLAEYESLYNGGYLKLALDDDGRTTIEPRTLYKHYPLVVEGIHPRLKDPEDDEISVLPGAVNVMTIHQSKGLEFEVVCVLRPDLQPRPATRTV